MPRNPLPYFLCCAALLAQLSPAQALTGVSGWASEEVGRAQSAQLIPADFDTLSATAPVTREEFCGVIVQLYEAVTLSTPVLSTDDPEVGSGSPFSDTDDPSVILASFLGLVSGRGGGRFDPDASITRQELCVMLSNVLRATDSSARSANRSVLDAFPDGHTAAAWAADDLARMVEDGILSGVGQADGTTLLSPNGTATREQAVLLALRFADVYSPQSEPTFGTGEDPEQPEPDPEPELPSSGGETNPPPPITLPDFGALTEAEKLSLVFGDGEAGFADEASAEAAMVEITVPVWRLKEDGTKVSGQQTLTVNRTLAGIVTEIFEEIFAGSERFPIKDAGCYAWRSNTRSEHRQGTAIDLNWNENMECNIDAETGEVVEITTGSHWTPGEDPYSIPADGDVVRAFKSHGFSWGGDCWETKRDYMHFSFFGR